MLEKTHSSLLITEPGCCAILPPNPVPLLSSLSHASSLPFTILLQINLFYPLSYLCV